MLTGGAPASPMPMSLQRYTYKKKNPATITAVKKSQKSTQADTQKKNRVRHLVTWDQKDSRTLIYDCLEQESPGFAFRELHAARRCTDFQDVLLRAIGECGAFEVA